MLQPGELLKKGGMYLEEFRALFGFDASGSGRHVSVSGCRGLRGGLRFLGGRKGSIHEGLASA